jgi:hypothetical protein
MKEGLLWYDDSPGRDLAEKIGRAARRYRQKFGTAPDVCYVHPSALGGSPPPKEGAGGRRNVGGVCVSSLPTVLRHHFWLGQEGKQRGQRAVKAGRG